MNLFQYHTDILARYPAIVGGMIHAHGLTNGSTPDVLQAAYTAEQQAVLTRIGSTPLSEIASLAAWRSAFRGFNVEPTQYRSAAEALLRRLTKKGDIPSINRLVDLGNLVSIRYALPVAVVDLRAVRGGLLVHFADGSEEFTPLGQPDVEHPEPGEVIFSDADKIVSARRWCWRQSEQSAAREDTTDVLITVEAHHEGGHTDVEAALHDLMALLKEYAGGDFSVGVLDADNPAFSA